MTDQRYICPECKRGWNSRPIHWRVGLGICNACAEVRLTHTKKGYVRPTRRHGAQWSEAERLALLSMVGGVSVKQIAKKLGRTPRGVAAKLKREGLKAKQQTILNSGMSTINVADELGVHIHTVRNWIGRGWLRARRVSGYYAINPENLTRFLHDIGWRLDCLCPTLAWKEVLADIAIQERKRVIKRTELVQSLTITSQRVTQWLRYRDFPKPLQGQSPMHGHQWFDREQIRQWFAAHPQYWSKAAVKAGFVDKWAFERDADCIVEGCKNRRHALGFCPNHYRQSQRCPDKFPSPKRRREYKVPSKTTTTTHGENP